MKSTMDMCMITPEYAVTPRGNFHIRTHEILKQDLRDRER